MQQSFQITKQLVGDFKAQEAAYLSPSYQESQVRQDFIDKFFAALGWDVTHERQKNPYEQEVKIENKVTIKGSQRRADYAFFISPNFRDVRFFVEAKKPSSTLANADSYHQAIRYGWNSKTPLVVLTDFEEFHVIDSRYQPDIKTALDRKVMSYHYSEYTNDEIFRRIFYLFGREAVAEGSIEKFVASLPKPRGKAFQQGLFKGGYKAVDEKFLEDLDEYREVLAFEYKKHNGALQGEQLTEAVQRTLDRLVFMRFLEDKAIEEPAIIHFRSRQSAWKAFLAHCRSLEPKYNGLVFKPHRIIDADNFQSPDDNTFADICDSLADPSSPYDFDKIPISILGSIYERFLGKVVHATDKRVRIEEKPEVRSVGGIFYTPEYIVRYIVSETVGNMISRKTPQEIARMRFADVACGSGSFLIEVYSELLDYHSRYYSEHPEAAKKGDVENRNGVIALSLKKKQEILLNNVFGIDIDFQAIEVTQLSLYLKLLEDVTLSETYQFGLLKERILPDLKANIICGNSLVGKDVGGLFGKQTEEILKAIDLDYVFPQVKKDGGFDAIVGNPPYVRMEEFKEFKEYLKEHYAVHEERSDLYAYFIERAHRILKRGGRFGMIISNKFLRANYGKPLREFLREHASLEHIVDFAGLPVFSEATVRTIVMVTSKRSQGSNSIVYSPPLPLEEFRLLQENVRSVKQLVSDRSFEVKPESLGQSVWSFLPREQDDLLKRLRTRAKPLVEYCDGQICRGVVSGLTEAFVIDAKIRQHILGRNKQAKEIIRPLLNGRDIQRYAVRWKKLYLIYTHHGVDIKRYPEVEECLKPYKGKLQKRATKQRWYELQQPQLNFVKYMEGPKIIFPDIATEPRFALDEKGCFGSNTTYFIPRKDYYLLGLLNSKVGKFYFVQTCAGLEGKNETYLRFFGQYLEDFPVPDVDLSDPGQKERHEKVVGLVKEIIEIEKKSAEVLMDAEVNRLRLQYESLDHQIDETVYELYGLTQDEIKIVEGQ